MSKEQQMNEYVPPQVEVIEVEVEKGFASSGNVNGSDMDVKPGTW